MGSDDEPVTVQLRTKRIYEDPDPADGARILVDRLWPRGVSKEAAALDEWAKELAPSEDLRRWYHHDTATWDEFLRRYRAELDDRRALVESTLLEREGTVTLLYASRDTERNNALALKAYVEQLAGGE